MIDVAELRRLHRVTRFDFWVAVAAIVGVLSAGVLAGVVIGVVLSLGWLVYVATAAARCRCSAASRDAGVPRPRREPRRRDVPGHRRPAPRRRPLLRDRRGARGARPRARRRASRSCARSCSTSRASNFIDSQGAAKLTELHELAEADGVDAAAGAREAAGPRRCSRRDGVVDAIGADHIHGNVHRAVEAQLAG